MDTAILVILLIVAVIILRFALRLERTETQRRVRSYRADTAARAVRRGGDLEEDALHIWRLQCAGQSASRREVVRRQEMTAGRWNKASALMAHLRLDARQTPYAEGAERIRAYVREQRRLAQRTTFVPPYS